MAANLEVKEPGNKVAKLIITCNVETGAMTLAGHLDNLDLILKMTVEAGHMILDLGQKRAKKALEDAKKT
ncbi:MAG: hypothetical protein V4587_06885 [Acidobacteriota bacterium]